MTNASETLMNTMHRVSTLNSTCVRSHTAQAQPFRQRGQGTLGKSFPCLQEEFADSDSWPNA